MSRRPLVLGFIPLVAVAIAAVAGCRSTEAAAATPGGREPVADGPGDVVVELFSSEGCSSCPSADVVFGRIAAGAGPTAHVYPLAFQVDYWNSLGWTDPYSTELATNRQRQYAASLGTGSIYTPQMIVGGVDAFVGSNEGRAIESISNAMAQAARAHLTVTATAGEGQTVKVAVHVDPVSRGAQMRIALVQRGIVSQVTAGENSGRTLHHENVVRAFASVPVTSADVTATLEVPSSVDRSQAEVIAYLQAAPDPGKGMPILGAGRTPAPRVH